MKVPPNQSDEHIINSSLDPNDSDDGLNDAPHSPSREGDFSEYLWMENEEEFEQQIMQQLEEEALMQQCIEAMQDEIGSSFGHNPGHSGSSSNYQNGNSNGGSSPDEFLSRGLQNLAMDEAAMQLSKLNPDAAEFVPRFGSATAAVIPAKED